jgi:hypothetical protein
MIRRPATRQDALDGWSRSVTPINRLISLLKSVNGQVIHSLAAQ